MLVLPVMAAPSLAAETTGAILTDGAAPAQGIGYNEYRAEHAGENATTSVKVPGIDGVLLGNDWGSQRDLLMSPATWRELLAPGAKREYDVIHEAGLDVWVHSCGNIRQIIPDLIEMGVDVLNPVQPECMDIFDLKDTFGDRMTFWGGISTQQTLPFGTEEEVEAETRRIAAYMNRDGGYLLAAAQGIQADVPFENICRLIDTANEMESAHVTKKENNHEK
jgi:uroporphyrinogen decarboxylase